MVIKIHIEKRLGVCKMCGLFYKCKPSDFSATKYCSRKCQLKDYAQRDRTQMLVGKKFNLLTILSYEKKDAKGNLLWLCKCDCGNLCNATTVSLRSEQKKSCGCLRNKKPPLDNGGQI